MSQTARAKLAEIVALPPEEMREIMLGIQEALEDIEDTEDVLRVRGEIARGETTLHSWEEVMNELGLKDADLDRSV